MLGIDGSYIANTTGTTTYNSLPEGRNYLMLTGKETGTKIFPPGGPCRQLFWIVTEWF